MVRSTLALRVLTGTGVAVCTLLAAEPSQAQQQQAGVTAAVRGRVEIAAVAGAVGRLAKSGEPIFLGNAIKSDAESGLQVLLLDQTTFTIGPDSELVIDEFVYDPGKGSGKVTATVARGVFRFVTGQVAKNNPADMVVKMPIGTIGIRGTIAMGSVTPATGQSTLQQEVALLGPGRDRDSKDRKGALLINTPSGANVNIDQAGFGSTYNKDGSGWGDATRWSPERLAALQARLTKASGQGPSSGLGEPGQASRDADTQPFDTKGAAQLASLIGGAVDFYDKTRADQSVDNRRPNDQTAMGGTPKIMIPNGPSTYDHLRTVNTGQFFYQGSAQLTSGSAYNIFANINFGSRTFGGGNSRAVFNDSNFAGTVNLGSLAFGSGPQTATFAYSNLTGLTGSGCSSGCRVDMNVTPQNQAGVVGATAQHNATVNALINFGAGTVPVAIATGSGTAGRNAGLAP
jgi:hypothetical protein